MPILDELKKKANGKADSANNIAEAIAQMDFSEGSVTPEEIAESVSAYLDEHLTNPTNPPIDTSLTIAGAAADSKETGDKISALKEEFTAISSVGKNLYNKDADNTIMGYLSGSGSSGVIASNANSAMVWIPITGGKTYTVSKTAGNRFQIGETAVQPAVGVSATSLVNNGTQSHLTATTSASAKYLVVIIWNAQYDTTITLADMKASVQIEEGTTATEYEPFGYSANDSVARNKIEQIEDSDALNGIFSGVTSNASPMYPRYGTAVNIDMSAMSGSGNARLVNGSWEINGGGTVSGSISNIVSGTTYMVELDVTYTRGIDGDININPATVVFADKSLTFFGAIDANWVIAFTPTTSGTVTLSVSFVEAWFGKLNGISIKAVTGLASAPYAINGISMFANYSNLSIGGQGGLLLSQNGGKLNTAYGINAQKDIDTGLWNTAIGYASQQHITQGKGNTSVGYSSQIAMTTGCYNNAVGESAQNHMANGQWNDGFGIEAQGHATSAKNNVAMGRRSQHFLETGAFNTAIGAWSGFNSHDASEEGVNAVKTSNGTTLIGGASTLKTPDLGDSDYATAVGFQTKVEKQGIAIGAFAEADEGGVAIGYGATAGANEVVISNKKIVFNVDGSVSWTAIN